MAPSHSSISVSNDQGMSSELSVCFSENINGLCQKLAEKGFSTEILNNCSKTDLQSILAWSSLGVFNPDEDLPARELFDEIKPIWKMTILQMQNELEEKRIHLPVDQKRKHPYARLLIINSKSYSILHGSTNNDQGSNRHHQPLPAPPSPSLSYLT